MLALVCLQKLLQDTQCRSGSVLASSGGSAVLLPLCCFLNKATKSQKGKDCNVSKLVNDTADSVPQAGCMLCGDAESALENAVFPPFKRWIQCRHPWSKAVRRCVVDTVSNTFVH